MRGLPLSPQEKDECANPLTFVHVDKPERQILGLGGALAYLMVWSAAAFVLFRLGVAAVWGMRIPFAPMWAVALAAVGVVALAWLAVFPPRDVNRRVPKEP